MEEIRYLCLFIYVYDRKLTKRDRKQLNIFERKGYRRILGPAYDNGKEN
jgi:hypothetical protein